MNRLMLLYTHELVRMRKYGITVASLAVTIIWVLIIEFSNVTRIAAFLPLILFIDATLMSLLLAGVTMIFEQQENALRSMLVLPITKGEYLVSKSLAVTTSSLLTLALLLIYGLVFKDLHVHIPGLVAAVALIAFTFSQVGMVMTYASRDFTDLLMGMFKFTIVFALPTILEFFQFIKGDWVKNLQYLNPTKNALVLLQAPLIQVTSKDLIIAIAYLALLAIVLFAMSHKLFDGYAAKEGGA